jgi:glycosyltransferase involved in cell wall biosynthesis
LPVPDGERISVVTPTLRRPGEVAELLENLSRQTVLPSELVLVDGAPNGEERTREALSAREAAVPFACVYIRRSGGTAIQRNIGIDAASGDYIAFIDDDIRLEPDFFEKMLEVFRADREKKVGGITGYITNQYLDPRKSPRWRWYRRLRLFSTYEPGRFDFKTGYPINRYLQAPHETAKEIDFMGAGCALWRRAVLDSGLRFSEFFRDYGILEDAHFALRARAGWKLLELGNARCVHLRSQNARQDGRRVARKTAVNYRFVFVDIVPQRTLAQELRFWTVQFVDLFRILAFAVRSRSLDSLKTALGKGEGIWTALWLPAPAREAQERADKSRAAKPPVRQHILRK